jgi:hypothetical protein
MQTGTARGNAAIKRIVRQYDMNGKRYYYVMLINTLDTDNKQVPTTRAGQENQRFQAQSGCVISFPDNTIVKRCEEITPGPTGDVMAVAVATPLQGVTIAGIGRRQRITAPVHFPAAGVRIYRLELEHPAVTPATMLFAKHDGGSEVQSAQGNTDKTHSTPEEFAQSEFWLSASPNPTADETTIRFTLGSDERVSLSLRDMRGVEMMNALQPQIRPAGTHELSISTRTLASGIYQCVLTAGSRRKAVYVHVIK